MTSTLSKQVLASDTILARLESLHPKVIDLSLDRILGLLAKLGNPQDQLPPVIHIAGTNGKGSTAATLSAIAEAAGHRVHVYTSPHLVRFHERIRVAGQLIDEDSLTALLEEIEAINDGDPITFFEVTTAAALLAFARTPADLCILEVGLGGRLDATNVISAPACCAITPVSMDHQQFLGDTLPAIAAEKAGIIKDGIPVIIGPQDSSALQIIAREADLHKAPASIWDREYMADIDRKTDELVFTDTSGSLRLPLPVLKGRHQIMNVGMAIAIARTQKAVTIPDAAIRAGLGWVRWPARLQPISASPLNDILPAGSDLWLDGGHNPAAAVVLKNFIHDQLSDQVADHPVVCVLGMLNTKDAKGYLQELVGVVDKIIAVDIPGQDNTTNAFELAASATDIGIQGVMAGSVTAAMRMINHQNPVKNDDTPAPFVIISGSLYLAGEVLRDIGYLPD